MFNEYVEYLMLISDSKEIDVLYPFIGYLSEMDITDDLKIKFLKIYQVLNDEDKASALINIANIVEKERNTRNV